MLIAEKYCLIGKIIKGIKEKRGGDANE